MKITLTKEKPKILLIRNDRIGDLILTLPCLEALRNFYPEAYIAVLVRSYTQEILYKNPNINEVILDDNKGFLKMLKEVRDKRFDISIVLYPAWKNALLCLLSRIPIRIGTGYKLAGILFNKRVYVHRTKVITHETDYCLKLIEGICPIDGVKKKVDIYVREEDIKFAEKLLVKYQSLNMKPLIIVHPGCGGSALNWTAENYAKLIDSIFVRYKVKPIITGSKQDKEWITKILSLIEEAQIINLTEQFHSLGKLAGLISLCNIFISPSTGPMHLAAGLGIPIVGLFSPIRAMSPLKWAPLGVEHQIITPADLICPYRKCRIHKCKLYNCMTQITPEIVLTAIEKSIDKHQKIL